MLQYIFFYLSLYSSVQSRRTIIDSSSTGTVGSSLEGIVGQPYDSLVTRKCER
jgi:hypothetical protein